MKPEMKNVRRVAAYYASGVFLLIALVIGMDAFLLIYLARTAGALVLTILSVQTWRTIWGRQGQS